MKTQIITIESHDDLISVRDKLSWTKTPRILLVWPKYEEIALRLLDLKVLQRHADSLGAQLGLVTRRSNVRRDAESLGIPVFDSTAAAQKDPWPDPVPRSRRIPKAPRRDLRAVRETVYRKESAWRTSLPGRVIAFTVGVMAILAVAGLFVPHAAVTLYPESKTQSAIIPVTASESIAYASITGSVPARKISVVTSVEQSLAVVSEIAAPSSKAQGIARFTNLTQAKVNIPAGTVVSTVGESPVRYVTLSETTLSAGVGQFVDVPIEALQPGSSGNAPSGQIKLIDGPLGLSATVTNPKLISGGADLKLIGATDADRAELRDVALENLRRDAEAKLRAQISSAAIFLADTFEISKVIEEMYDPPAGQAGKTLTLKMKVEFSARYISEDDLKQLAYAALNSSIPTGFEPFSVALFKPLAEPATDTSGVTHFELNVTRVLHRAIDKTQIFSVVRGHNPELIKDDLTKTFSLRQQPEIVLSPAWWPWMPLIPFNISVETK